MGSPLPAFKPLDSLSPGDLFSTDRAAPDPALAEVSAEAIGELGGGSRTVSLECAYRNATDRMVILRCLGPSAFFLERVLFPFELLTFVCPVESEVEILSNGLGGPELLEAMPAQTLRLSAPLPPLQVAAGEIDAPTPWQPMG
jgi:hypothetical protein